MRYSFEYKKKCVELYRQGIWVETPDGFTDPRNFHSMIRKWNRIAENCGIEKLKHEKNKKWSFFIKFPGKARIFFYKYFYFSFLELY